MRLVKVSQSQLNRMAHGDVAQLFNEASVILKVNGGNVEFSKSRYSGSPVAEQYPSDVFLVVTDADGIAYPEIDRIANTIKEGEQPCN